MGLDWKIFLIKRILEKEKRTQPRLTDLLRRKKVVKEEGEEEMNEIHNKKGEEEEKKEELDGEEKEKPEASQGGGATVTKTKISDTWEESMEEGKRHYLEPVEEGGGGSLNHHTLPYPISVMPGAVEGETSQEGQGRRLHLGAGKRDLGPAFNNVKPTRILEEAVEESATSIALEKLD